MEQPDVSPLPVRTGEPGDGAARLRAYRLGRLQAEMRRRDVGACILFDPLNVRFATGTRNLQVWHMHAAGRHAVVPAEGRAVLYEFGGCEYQAEDVETIAEVRVTPTLYYFAAGPRLAENKRRWAAEIADLLRQMSRGSRRIAVDRVGVEEVEHLRQHGYTPVHAEELLEQARAVKSADEIACLAAAVAVCEEGMARMREALRPEITENELWSLLHQTNIARGGEWIETRLLASGPRTFPWFQECSDRAIQAGDLVAFDTDMVGPSGYLADISRTFRCGAGPAADSQRRLYQLAHEQLERNLEQVRAGATFRDLADRAWTAPADYQTRYNSTLLHGVGMVDEYPRVPYPRAWETSGYDGILEENMCVAVHSYLAAPDRREAVMLEEQVVVTASGHRRLSTFPFEAALLR
jgi:Xaa-Pro aminopeptidase